MKLRSLVTVAAATAAAALLSASPASAREPGPYNVQQLAAGAKLPRAIKVEGREVLQVWTWQEHDRVNTSYAVFSQTHTVRDGRDERFIDHRLFVQLYSGKGHKQKQLRIVRDGVTGCSWEATADLVPGSISVTDVDNDGTSELTFAYDLACRTDMSPADRKLLVLEGTAKHALRGTQRVDLGPGHVYGGDYEADAFKGAPRLKQLAEDRWKHLVVTASVTMD